MNDRELLADGFVYLEIMYLNDTDREGNPRVSKKTGDAMLEVCMNATDKNGMVGRIYDYLMPSLEWKLESFERAFNVAGIYDHGTKTWNKHMLRNKAAMGTCKVENSNPAYAAKNVIASYLPPEVVKKLKGEETEATAVKGTTSISQTAPQASSFEFEEDGIPF